MNVWYRCLAAAHLVLLGLILWLAADPEAHRKFHELSETGAGHQHTEAHGNDSEGHHDEDESHCVVTLFQQGKLDSSPLPAVWTRPPVGVALAEFLPPVFAPIFSSVSQLPFSCGPPA